MLQKSSSDTIKNPYEVFINLPTAGSFLGGGGGAFCGSQLPAAPRGPKSRLGAFDLAEAYLDDHKLWASKHDAAVREFRDREEVVAAASVRKPAQQDGTAAKHERAIRLVVERLEISQDRARGFLEQSGWDVDAAIVQATCAGDSEPAAAPAPAWAGGRGRDVTNVTLEVLLPDRKKLTENLSLDQSCFDLHILVYGHLANKENYFSMQLKGPAGFSKKVEQAMFSDTLRKTGLLGGCIYTLEVKQAP